MTRSGAPRSVPEELDALGLTARQRLHWCSTGVLDIAQDEHGRYVWTPQAVAAARTIQRLLDLGFSLPLAGLIARHASTNGNTELKIAPGVYVRATRGGAS